MIRKIFAYISLLVAMTACSVDEINAPSGLTPDGEISVTLDVPSMQVVSTRADENTVESVTMLVLTGNTVQQQETFSGTQLNSLGNKQYKISCKLNPELHSKSDLKFYFFGNLPSGVEFTTGSTTESEIRSSITTENLLSGSNMVMSASANLNEIIGGNSVALLRNAAKVTVTDAVEDGDTYKPGSTSYDFQVYGASTRSSVAAATINDNDYLGAATAANIVPALNNEPYVHNTLNNGRDAKNRPFIIVKAPFEGADYYYKVEFEKQDKITKKITTLSLLCNHEYQVMITKVNAKGANTPAEAASISSSVSLLDVVINDFTPHSYNMISDGTRELGVSHELSYNGDPTVGTSVMNYIYVKIYSPDSSEYPLTAAHLSVSNSWIVLDQPEELTDADDLGDASGMNSEFTGKVYRVPVYFQKTQDPGSADGKIIVAWKGLSREIPVIWTRDFQGQDLCSVQLSIKKPGQASPVYSTQTDPQVTDYWDFVQKPRCYGLKTSENNDKVRNAGLHFPINYGGNSASTRWTYEYEVEFKDLNDGNPYDWKCSTSGVSGIQISRTSGTANGGETVKITVTRNATGDDWNYETGKLSFSVAAPNSEEWTAYSLDLYHTGFFDNPKLFRDADHRVDMTQQDEFYYYEVIQGPAGKYYWLDRNLGSHSAAMYIEATGEITYMGDEIAAGGYYQAAQYNEGGDPEMYEDLCPPGYEIPRVDIWNTLRNSPDFITSQSGTYYRADFTNADGQKVYFPKALYFDANGSTKIGESRAGYYWTSTKADGLEKDQIGNWLRYLKLSGSIASYDNAEVNGRQGSKGMAMMVRCVNKTEAPTSIYRTHFNVAHATHVYLYSLVDPDAPDTRANRNPVFNWPGKAIGNYITMQELTQLVPFSYESNTTKPQAFYVMFTFRDEDGIWHTMSKGTGTSTIYSTDRAPENLKGWQVVGDTWINKDGDAVTTDVGGTWYCDFSTTAKTANVYFEEGEEIVVPDIKVFDNTKTYALTFNGTHKLWLWIIGGDDVSADILNEEFNNRQDHTGEISFKPKTSSGSVLKYKVDNDDKEYPVSIDSFVWNESKSRYEAAISL